MKENVCVSFANPSPLDSNLWVHADTCFLCHAPLILEYNCIRIRRATWTARHVAPDTHWQQQVMREERSLLNIRLFSVLTGTCS